MLFQLLLILCTNISSQFVDLQLFETTIQNSNARFYMRQHNSLFIYNTSYERVARIRGSYCNIVDTNTNLFKWYLYHPFSQDQLIIILALNRYQPKYKWINAFPKNAFILA
jgi:hypothetical protein